MSALARNTAELAKIFKVIETAPQAVGLQGFETALQLCARKGENVHRDLNILSYSCVFTVHSCSIRLLWLRLVKFICQQLKFFFVIRRYRQMQG